MDPPDIQKQLQRHFMGTEEEKLAIENARARLPEIEERLRATILKGLKLAKEGDFVEAQKLQQDAEMLVEQYNKYLDLLS